MLINNYQLRSRKNQYLVFRLAQDANIQLLKQCLDEKLLNFVTTKPSNCYKHEQLENQTIFERCLYGFDKALQSLVSFSFVFC